MRCRRATGSSGRARRKELREECRASESQGME
jgi:hypothetical protein